MIADGPPRRVLETVADGRLELVMPTPVPAELERVLVTKLGLDPGAATAILTLLAEITSETVAVPERVEAVTGDPDDDRILAAAVAAGADVLVSGDTKHLLPVGSYGGVRIARPQDLLAEV